MKRAMLLALLFTACAHNGARRAERAEAKVGAKGNVGLTVAELTAKLGEPTGTDERDAVRGVWFVGGGGERTRETEMMYSKNRDGLHCITTYDVRGGIVMGAHLKGDGCYSGLATY